MANWLLKASEKWLRPVYDVLHEQPCRKPVLHADETTLQVLKEPGRSSTSKSYMWLYRTSGCAKQAICCMSISPRGKRSTPSVSCKASRAGCTRTGIRGIYISMFCHGSIYFCGFVTIGGAVCSAKDAPKLALGVARMAIRAAILRPFVVGSEQLLIYILLDAAAIRQLIPERAWSVALPVYYLAAAAFVLLAIRGFFRRNQKQYRRFSAVQAA